MKVKKWDTKCSNFGSRKSYLSTLVHVAMISVILTAFKKWLSVKNYIWSSLLIIGSKCAKENKGVKQFSMIIIFNCIDNLADGNTSPKQYMS